MLVETDSDSEDSGRDPWINRRQAVIHRKKHADHRRVISASPASDDHESLLRSDQLEKCAYVRSHTWSKNCNRNITRELKTTHGHVMLPWQHVCKRLTSPTPAHHADESVLALDRHESVLARDRHWDSRTK